MSPRFAATALSLVPLFAVPAALAQSDAPPPPSPADTTAQAPPRRSVASLILEGVVEYGGDDLLEVIFTDGTTQTVLAGQGGTIAVGVEARPFARVPVLVRGTVGFKFVLTAADNANIRFTRFPIEAIAAYRHTSGVRVGAGVSYHAGVRLYGDGFLEDRSFDSAVGPTLEIGYKGVSLTATRMAYRASTGAAERVDGSSIGLSFAGALRQF